MAKNIEMNIKTQEQNYEILYPKTIPNQVENLLNDDTKEYIGLKQTATPDDAFRQLYLLNVLNDKCAFKLTVKTNSGYPLSNIQVESTSFIDSRGNSIPGPLLTNEKGEINTFFKSGNVTLSIKNYADLKDWSQQYQVQNGEQYEKKVQLETINFQKYISSKNIKFSSNVNQVDVTCVGGGGGSSEAYGDYYISAGAGGYCVVNYNVSFEKNLNYELIVGNGGSSAPHQSGDSNEHAFAGKGGTSSFLNVIANGGDGGGCSSRRSGYITGPSKGNGNGAYTGAGEPTINATEPSQQGFFSFDEMGYYGGGGGLTLEAKYGGYEYYYPTGYGGGKIGSNWQNPKDGYGGGASNGDFENLDAIGGSGCVAIRMHLKYT